MSKHTNHSTNGPENSHVNQFSFELVHRHIVNPFTSFKIAFSFEEAKLTNHSTNEPETLHVNQFSSKLVHRHVIYSLTLLKQPNICPNNMQAISVITNNPCEPQT